MKYGPGRTELRIRLAISLAGLGLLAGALAIHGIPQGPAIFEVIGVAGLFFGGSALWTGRKLLKGEYPDGL